MKFVTLAAAVALFAVTSPALAQASGIAVGAIVYGAGGEEVGTVDRIDGGNVVLKSGELSAALPAAAFGKSGKGLTITLTKEQFVSAVTAANQKSAQALTAALAAGADIYSSDGQVIGKVKSVADDGSVIVTASAGEFTAKKEQVALNGDKLTFLATKADVDAALAKKS
jgi:preprotein translocase subunit YajC